MPERIVKAIAARVPELVFEPNTVTPDRLAMAPAVLLDHPLPPPAPDGWASPGTPPLELLCLDLRHALDAAPLCPPVEGGCPRRLRTLRRPQTAVGPVGGALEYRRPRVPVLADSALRPPPTPRRTPPRLPPGPLRRLRLRPGSRPPHTPRTMTSTPASPAGSSATRRRSRAQPRSGSATTSARPPPSSTWSCAIPRSHRAARDTRGAARIGRVWPKDGTCPVRRRPLTGRNVPHRHAPWTWASGGWSSARAGGRQAPGDHRLRSRRGTIPARTEPTQQRRSPER